jgi:uncharacterized membrane protein YoaK (UPF0700 family)
MNNDSTHSVSRPSPQPLPLGLSDTALLVSAAGYLDGFTWVGHGHVFSNNMTGNVVLLGVDLVSRSWDASFSHILPILAFFLGVAAAQAIHSHVILRALRHTSLMVLSVEIAALLLLGFLPGNTPSFCFTFSIAFVAAVQVQTFREIDGESFSSTFLSGDLRTLSESLFDWISGKRTAHTRTRIRDFAVICAVFLFGAAGGGFVVSRLGNKALWVDVVLLSIVLVSIWPTRTRAEIRA